MVSIKRPRKKRQTVAGTELKDSKSHSEYWRKRVFKARYVYKGKQVANKNWSVKIQYLGERRTISLRSQNLSQAANEARRIYRAIVEKGWEKILKPRHSPPGTKNQRAQFIFEDPKKFEEDYWMQKLIHRQHTVSFRADSKAEWSVRVDYRGMAHYFPLQTSEEEPAAKKALQIFRSVIDEGWEKTFTKFPRELTLAFRWSDSPLAWTYSTIHTETNARHGSSLPTLHKPGNVANVAVAESDEGIRQALVSWINRMDRFKCVAGLTSVTDILHQLKSGHVELLLASHNLVSQSGTSFTDRLKKIAPRAACLLYSSYEDSEDLFRATPGGSGVYLLKRTPPTNFFEPIEASVENGNFSPEKITSGIWTYFKEIFNSLPGRDTRSALAELTRREQEVLALLAKGFPDKEIADQLQISVWTVNGHVKNIFDKLNVHNRTEAVLKYLQK